MPITVEDLSKLGMVKGRIQEKREEIPSLDLDAIRNLIREQKRLPREERDYFYLFMLLERYALKHNPQYTKEDLRNDIKAQFNTRWFSHKLVALFTFENPELLIFTYTIIETFLDVLKQHINPTSLQGILNGAVKDFEGLRINVTQDKIDIEQLQKVIFRNEDLSKQSLVLIHNMSSSLFTFARINLGASATEKLFSTAFQKLKERYIQFPAFIEAVKALPEGILEKNV